ncbi:MAG: ABC transporter permease subunit [Desulfurococcales archaeon]|nr:ABC transporter permease subunit [Desulfurococcales archaeon]
MPSLLRVVLWKEIIDLLRDRRTLVATLFMPLVGLPLLALITGAAVSQETIVIHVIVEDPNNETISFADSFYQQYIDELNKYSLSYTIVMTNDSNLSGVQVAIIFPVGFSQNMTRLDGTARVYVSVLLGSPAAERAAQIARMVLSSMEYQMIIQRVENLSSIAGIQVDPYSLLNPIAIYSASHKPGGQAATSKEVGVASSARLLEFALFFVANPAIFYMIDSFMGEKERRTIESLLATPIPRRTLVAGKLLSSVIVGLIVAFGDFAGVMIYFYLTYSAGLVFTPGLVIVHVVTSLLLVILTASMALPIAIRAGSVRAAQGMALVMTLIAMSIYFTALVVDITSLSLTSRAIFESIPLTHAVLVIHYYILGETMRSLLHILVMGAFAVAFYIIGTALVNDEKLVMFRD